MPRQMQSDPGITATHQEKGTFELYLQDIGRYPLLTVKQERELAERIQKGDMRAREQMIQSNLRLVVRIAKDYAYYGVPLLDLISEGNIGLMKAAERFDPGKDVKFATYAAWWIKQCVKRALANQGKTIRLPIHLTEKLSRISKATDQLREKHKREPTNEEVAKVVGMPLAKVVHLKLMRLPPASLDAKVGEDGNELGSLIADESAATPLQSLLSSGLRKELGKRLKLMSEREREILRMRFGLDEQPPRTLEEVGQQLGITRERVRQIEGEALVKLRVEIEKANESKTAEEVREEKRERQRAAVFSEFVMNLRKDQDEDEEDEI